MSDYRKFWLMNSMGNTYDLTSANLSFMANPSNLGFTKTYDALRLGNRMAIIDEYLGLMAVNGELLFFGRSNSEKYQKYFDFVQFIKFKPLTLFYQTPNIMSSEDAFHTMVTITSLEKSEVGNDDSILTCPIVMQMLHHWETSKKSVVATGVQTNGKKYPNSYPYAYSGNGLTGITLMNEGTEDVGLVITLNDQVTNPSFALSNEDGIYGIARFVGTFDSLYLNSIDTEESIVLMSNGLAVTNPLNYQDLTVGSPNQMSITFLKLKTGTSNLAFTSDNEYEGSVIVEFTPAYATV